MRIRPLLVEPSVRAEGSHAVWHDEGREVNEG
jgi:hypothetical protein